MIDIDLPLKTKGGLNTREHYMARANRTRFEGATTYYMLGPYIKYKKTILEYANNNGLTIRLIRYSPRAKWLERKRCWQAVDDDNLRGVLKGIRDAIAKWLGIDDGDDRLTFVYEQAKGPAKVKVVMRPRNRGSSAIND